MRITAPSSDVTSINHVISVWHVDEKYPGAPARPQGETNYPKSPLNGRNHLKPNCGNVEISLTAPDCAIFTRMDRTFLPDPGTIFQLPACLVVTFGTPMIQTRISACAVRGIMYHPS